MTALAASSTPICSTATATNTARLGSSASDSPHVSDACGVAVVNAPLGPSASATAAPCTTPAHTKWSPHRFDSPPRRRVRGTGILSQHALLLAPPPPRCDADRRERAHEHDASGEPPVPDRKRVCVPEVRARDGEHRSMVAPWALLDRPRLTWRWPSDEASSLTWSRAVADPQCDFAGLPSVRSHGRARTSTAPAVNQLSNYAGVLKGAVGLVGWPGWSAAHNSVCVQGANIRKVHLILAFYASEQ